MEENLEILRKHKEVLRREYMQTSYLDQFPLTKYDLSNVTVIIPTFNRSPHPIEEDSNPLGWCLESLLAQRNGGLDEIVVVDDASIDYTEDIVGSFSEGSSVPITYFRNKERKGSSISRNRGIEISKNDLVMFVDDDCVFSRYMLFGANYTLNLLDNNVSLLHLPTYHRRTMPLPIKISEIGVLDINEGVIGRGNFDGFPVEYAENIEDSFIDEELKVLRPIEIRNLAGISLAKKRAIEEAGGFPENLSWGNGYREETELALRLFESGHKMFFTPDPKFHCVHLKYGEKDEEEISGKLESRLEYLIRQSDVSRKENGNRVDTEGWFYDLILSTYVVLGNRSPDAANKYAERVLTNFVLNNNFVVGGSGTKIEDRAKRQAIFDRAIREGEELIKVQSIL